MSTYFGASITIRISEDFTWIDKFTEALYVAGSIDVYPLNKLTACNNRYVRLPKEQSRDYFELYIKQLQGAVSFDDLPSSIWWRIDGIDYAMDVYSRKGYITLSLQLCSNKKYKDIENRYDDFEYYLRFFIKTMRSFPILKVWAGCIDNFGDPEWNKIEGKWWKFKIQDPQPEDSFQMLDIILSRTLNKNFLANIVEYAAKCNYRFFPHDISPNLSRDPQSIIASLPNQGPFPENWIAICDGIKYAVHVGSIPCARLLFKTEQRQNTPYIDVLVTHVLNIFSPEIIEQVATFDSRYNCLSDTL